MTPEQLKASILQYAMEGKLVKQNPNDESVSELLKRIKAEKQQLIKEKKIKRNKSLPLIEDNEKSFDIPDSWKWVRLDDIFYLKAGKNKKAKDISDSKDENNKYLCYGGNGIRGYVADYNQEGKHPLIGRQGALCGNVHIAQGKFYATEHAIVVHLFGNVDYKWSAIFLKAINLNQYATSTAQPGLSVTRINRVLIPLPPLEEQKRIVSKIEKLMPLVDEYAESYNHLQKIDNEFEDKLNQSVLQYAMEGKLVKQNPSDEPASELIKKIENEKTKLIKEGKIKKNKKLPAITEDEKPFDIPDNWEWVRFSELFNIQGGSQPPKSLFSSVKKKNMIRLYQIRDYGSNPVPVYIPKDSTKKMTKKGDILLARYGASLGKVFWAEDGGYNVAMAKVIPYFESNNIFKSYLFFYFKSSVYQKFITSNSRSAQAGFNKGDLEKLLMPVPPLEEQKRIVAKIQKLQDSISSLSR